MKKKVKAALKAVIPAKVWVQSRTTLLGWAARINKQLTPFNRLRYRGTRYHCPLCDSGLSQLQPYGVDSPALVDKNVVGGGYRLNARCPVCYSTDRDRLLYLYLTHKTTLFTVAHKLLHIAPEGHLSQLIKQHRNIDYLTADLRSKNVMVKMDITQINYPDNTFDAVLCNHVLEHIADDTKAMAELYRVLKVGGWAILQVPMSLILERSYEDSTMTTPAQKMAAFGQNDHVRIYAMDYVDKLKAAGFVVTLFKWWQHEADFGHADNHSGLLKDETLFYVTKQN